jgi:F-type H+-transporting ATPase subunit delta
MKNLKAASRYAKSLLDLSIEKGQLDRVYGDMQFIASEVVSNRDVMLMIKSPIIKADTKMRVLLSVFAGNIGELALAFIQIIADKGRESLLPEIADDFIRQVKAHKNILSVTIISAYPLEESAKQRIVAELSRNHRGAIEIQEATDASVIGGFILRIGDKQIDSSVAGHFRAMRKEFRNNPYERQL